jgi:ribosome-associated heat shock protein Hsp15
MSRHVNAAGEEEGKLRLDKWLWAARFYKTRQLAHEALELGRVMVGGERVKASRVVKVGDRLHLRINQLEYDIEVLALTSQRRSAREAQSLYAESEASHQAREEKQALLKAERVSYPYGAGRPTKKDRREIQRFKNGS